MTAAARSKIMRGAAGLLRERAGEIARVLTQAQLSDVAVSELPVPLSAPSFEEWWNQRRALAERYFEHFATVPACELPPRPRAGDGQSWNMFCVLLPLHELAQSLYTYAQRNIRFASELVRDAASGRHVA